MHSGDTIGTISYQQSFRCNASSHDPAQGSITGLHKFSLKREDSVIEVIADTTIRSTDTAFHIIINLNVIKDGLQFFRKEWTASEPRRLL